jgi:hypothetical protein
MVKTSKNPMLESRCTSGSSLLNYIMINYHHRSFNTGYGQLQLLLQLIFYVVLREDEVRQVGVVYSL